MKVYQQIDFDDITNIMSDINFVQENPKIPFPQANSFYKILDLINELGNKELSALEVSEIYEFDIRQSHYYLSAAKYLGLVKKNQAYELSSLGKTLLSMDHKSKNLRLIHLILSHEPFYYALNNYFKNGSFETKIIASIIYKCRSEINRETAERRTGTIVAWIKWIIELISTNNDEDYFNNMESR